MAQPFVDLVLTGAATPTQRAENLPATSITWDDALARRGRAARRAGRVLLERAQPARLDLSYSSIFSHH
jgi:hypothetical protein